MKYNLKGKGFFAFSDPGGANPILAIIDEMVKCDRQNDKDFMVFTNSTGVFPEEYNAIVRINDFSCNVYSEIMSEFKPDYVFTATSNNDYEHNIRLVSNQKGLRTLAFVDHWTKYIERFTFDNKTLFPDEIWVINDVAKIAAIEAGLPKNKIFISGNPYYDKIRQFVPKNDRAMFLKEHDIPVDKKIIMFISDDIRNSVPKNENAIDILGYDEYTVLSDLLDSFYEIHRKGLIDFSEYILLIKLHPRGKINKFNSIIKNTKYDFLNILVKKDIHPLTINYYSDYILGMYSNMVIESLLMGKKVLRVQTGQAGEDLMKFDKVKCKLVKHDATLLDDLITVLEQ